MDEEIEAEEYQRQRALLAEEESRTYFEPLDLPDTEEDFERLLERVTPLLTSLSTFWREAPAEAQRRLQALVFPRGGVLRDDSLSTPEVSCFFSALRPAADGKEAVVEQIRPTFNQLRAWLVEAAAIARAA
jgi:hypothetical protein